ncbi:torsin-1A-like [Paramacrobiotus metropolitanus]|uniref:torsin-1A-like n=1 Tax=Paramacrobiotus metropolitanus TaxID=2943436 RepID=UPI0024462063|nr:torsin-1A-like [Paramacrobiotus metropolitanus]
MRLPPDVVVVLLLILECCAAIEPLTMGGLAIGALTSAGVALYANFKCKILECCAEPYVRSPERVDRTLKSILHSRVYGQHIAIDLVLSNVHNHLTTSPKKPLVMSFHGGTGVGKNYVARLIAQMMFKKGTDSKFHHLLISTLDFASGANVVASRMHLQSLVKGNLSECPRSLFIFDEVEKIPSGILDGLQPFLDYHDSLIHGVDPRKAIFIFLSNTGRRQIDTIAYEAWEHGRSRESLTIQDFQKTLQLSAFNEKSGLLLSDLIQEELVDIYIPFLPLERKHVEGCIRDYITESNYTINESVVESIADELDYLPKEDPRFSATGCKRIREKFVGFKHKLQKIVPQDEKLQAKRSSEEEAEG